MYANTPTSELISFFSQKPFEEQKASVQEFYRRFSKNEHLKSKELLDRIAINIEDLDRLKNSTPVSLAQPNPVSLEFIAEFEPAISDLEPTEKSTLIKVLSESNNRDISRLYYYLLDHRPHKTRHFRTLAITVAFIACLALSILVPFGETSFFGFIALAFLLFRTPENQRLEMRHTAKKSPLKINLITENFLNLPDQKIQKALWTLKIQKVAITSLQLILTRLFQRIGYLNIKF